MSREGGPAIAAAGVRKCFGETVVLDGVDLTVAEGTIFALLGPNGAGKTTIVRILSTLVPADAGELRVAGHDVHDDPDGVRAAIGVTGQFSAVDEMLTPADAAGSPSCWSASTWSPRRAGRRRPTPAGCAGGWTWP
jgi:ABC-type multidrug transport system ATPase subunit